MAKTPQSVRYFESELRKLKAPARPAHFAGAHYVGAGQSKWVYLDVGLPPVRNLLKKPGPHSQLSPDQQFQFFEELWFQSRIFEAKAMALIWLEKQSNEDLLRWAPQLVPWAGEVDNWAHSDGLCACYARIFEHSPSALLGTYKKWNKSKNPWLRRISLVGLIFYSRLRKKQPSWALIQSFLSPHLSAPEYFVQKAVGWTLRESYNVYPQQTTKYIDKNLPKISAVAWVAASEKMPGVLKKGFLKKRKLLRKVLTD